MAKQLDCRCFSQITALYNCPCSAYNHKQREDLFPPLHHQPRPLPVHIVSLFTQFKATQEARTYYIQVERTGSFWQNPPAVLSVPTSALFSREERTGYMIIISSSSIIMIITTVTATQTETDSRLEMQRVHSSCRASGPVPSHRRFRRS
jgi:hypothetical protein